MDTRKKLQYICTASLFSLLLFLIGCTANTSRFVPAPEPIVTIVSVKCIKTTIGSDEDDVYIYLHNGKRYPTGKATQTMRAGTVWKPNIFTPANETGSIQLLEGDAITDDDPIGIFRYNEKTQAGRYTETMTGDFSVYEVVFEVRR